MTTPRLCPTCGAELSASAPDGLCPRCLLQCGLDRNASEATPQAAASTAPYQGPAWSAPTPAELARHFPQLEIIELLGQGGMGAVYKARQPRLNRFVAVKILPAHVGRDPAFAERFAREAQALARLSHPQIIAVHDFGESDSLFYFIMEYVDGMNLRQLLHAGLLPPDSALRIIPQICEALQFAHDEGVVHRDIKPENILVDKRGRVHIADFGLAKLLNPVPARDALTGAQQVMGTPHYMAPEQMERPLDVDHRADIYSLGVVFYEMLTGELPLGHFVPPSQKVQVDVRLDEVVLRALAREPERRFQHVSDVKTAVESIVSGAPSAAGAAGTDAARPKPSLLGRVAAMAVAVVRKLRWPGGWQQLFGTATGWALLACLLGLAVGCIPWVRVEINAPAGGGFMNITVTGQGGWSSSRGNWQGITVTTTFAVLGLLLYLAGRREQRPRWQPVPLVLAGAVIIIVSSLLLWEIAHPGELKITSPVQTSNNVPEPFMQPLQMFMGNLLQQVPQMIKVTAGPGPYLAIGLGVGLILLAGWAVLSARRSLPVAESTAGKGSTPGSAVA